MRTILTALLCLTVSCAQASAAPQRLPVDALLPGAPAAEEQVARFSPDAMRRAVADMQRRWPDVFPSGEAARILERIDRIENDLPGIRDGLKRNAPDALGAARRIVALQQDVLLRNPLLEPGQIMLIERRVGPLHRAGQLAHRPSTAGRPGPESDCHLLPPMAFHASTSALVQMLKRGHYGVKLTDDEWSVLYTWIDLNAPYHGSIFEMSRGAMNRHWTQHEVPFVKMPSQNDALGLPWNMEAIKGLYAYRLELMGRFSPVVYDAESEFAARKKLVAATGPIEFVKPAKPNAAAPAPAPADWRFSAEKAVQMRDACAGRHNLPRTRQLEAGSLTIDMVLIPGCKYVSPGGKAEVVEPFYLSAGEISLAESKQFDANHDNRFFDRPGKDQSSPGHSLRDPALPAIRVTWDRATAFCKWLGKTNDVAASLPTDTQWHPLGSGMPFSTGY